jgi:predicted ATPase/DNA-binding SARP family transcriptional activator
LTLWRGGEKLTATVPQPAPALVASLPAPLTAFIGREHEVAEVRRLLESARLLTLTGAGGSGKTRLALEVTARAEADGRAIAWVELAPLADPDALAMHVALALGIRSEGAASPEQALVARIAGQALLLVLDNCEHVVDAAAQLVATLLAACPSLRVLATSREALGVSGERSWLVPPLSLPPVGVAPDVGTAAATEAVRLFVARAREVSRTFALTAENVEAVVRICRRLDGLPLALELAAARAAVLAPAQIAARLEDRFALLVSGARAVTPRQRTLRSAVDWSYDLLDTDERILLERLSVFAGGFTLDAAESVCAGGMVPAARLLDLLSALATKSLVTMQEEGGTARYRLLETIREYAIERRRERGEDAQVDQRHAAYYLALAQAAEPDLILGRVARMHDIDVEHDNVLAALGWSAAHRQGARIGLPIVWALLWYWFHRQLWREGFAQAERALDTADAPAPQHRAAALHAMGLFGMYARDPRSSERLAEAQQLWREAGIERWQAFTRLVETIAASLRKDVETATRFADEMLALAQRQPDPWDTALAKAHGVVPVLIWREQWNDASRLLDESLVTYRACDYPIGIAYVLDAQAFVSLQLGDASRAVRLAANSLRFDPSAENRWLAGRSLRILGAVAAQRGDRARALTLFGAADAMYEAIGARSLTAERVAVNEVPERLRATMDPSEHAAAWDLGRAMRFRDAVAFALDLADLEPPSAQPTAATASAAPSRGAAPEVAIRSTAAVPVLEVRALGRLTILRDGAELPAESWSYAKPRELLLYLLAHPDGRTREQIGLDFWPDISAAQVKNNFHVTLHHLRKALGDAALIRFERGRYRVAMEAGVRFDAARFEESVTAALARLRSVPGDAEAGDALESALAAWHGAFLEEEQAGDWHLELRDRLGRRFEEGLEELGKHMRQRGEHARAAEAFRRLLVIDPLHEANARRLMRALARDGRRADALTVFERLARAVRTELEDDPDTETLALAEQIRQGTFA